MQFCLVLQVSRKDTPLNFDFTISHDFYWGWNYNVKTWQLFWKNAFIRTFYCIHQGFILDLIIIDKYLCDISICISICISVRWAPFKIRISISSQSLVTSPPSLSLPSAQSVSMATSQPAPLQPGWQTQCQPFWSSVQRPLLLHRPGQPSAEIDKAVIHQ